MERLGLIQGHSTKIDFGMIENTVKAYVTVRASGEHRKRIIRQLCRHPRSIAVYKLTGENDVMAVFLFPNAKEFQKFAEKNRKVKGAKSVTVQVVTGSHKGVVWSGA